MLKAIFDAGPLITTCKFTVQGRLVLDYLLDECQIAIPPSVQTEVITAGRRFPDAQEAQQRISTEEIQMDDYLGYMVSDRLGVRKSFLLDLILRLVKEDHMSRTLAIELVEAVRPRYALGCVEHTLLLLR